MVNKKFEDFTQTEQDVIVAYRRHKFLTEIEELDWDSLDDDMYVKILIFTTLATHEGCSWVDGDNNEHSVVNGEFISKKYIPKNDMIKKEQQTEQPTPAYVFERIEYQKEVIVEGKKGFVTDWEEYINGKTYYEYSEDSYERKNWRTIEYTWKHYIND